MGLDITVFAVDWARLGETAADRRMRLLLDTAYPDDDDGDGGNGWRWHPAQGAPWCAVYAFHSTTGSYKPHFWAGQAWDDVREAADPALREALNGFLLPLIREGTDHEPPPPDTELFPAGAEPWTPLVTCRPETVSGLAACWSRAAPLLDGLRETYAEHAACPGRWIEDFDEFATLLREWAEVVGEADRRSWGVVGLPY